MPCCRFSREDCDQGILYDVRAWSVRALRSTEVVQDRSSKGRKSTLPSFPIRPAWGYMKRKTARMGKRTNVRGDGVFHRIVPVRLVGVVAVGCELESSVSQLVEERRSP